MPQQLMRARQSAPKMMLIRINKQTHHHQTAAGEMRLLVEQSPKISNYKHTIISSVAPILSLTTLCLAATIAFLLSTTTTQPLCCLAAAAATDEAASSLASRFALESAAADFRTTSAPPSFNNRSNTGSPFVWQPLPLRATFRPLNRASPPPEQPIAPRAPRQPRPPQPLALSISERSISNESPFSSSDNSFFQPGPSSRSNLFGSSNSRDANNEGASASFSSSNSFFQPSTTSFEASTTALTFAEAPTTTAAASTLPPTTTTTTTTPQPNLDEDELPTRQPLTRFRPTRAPAEDEDAPSRAEGAPSSGGSGVNSVAASASSLLSSESGTNNNSRMSQECFECICEASTNCNAQSRCQTSDVRHTRCGLFLISYDQWLATGLSRELVSREALAQDAAADERAFYECVTQRDCAQRLLNIYMARHRKDCDKDGRVDCYDLAAIHHSGMEQCASETLLDSQYWSDFNACLGFGRRRRR